jgi:hypothetical protein
VSARFAHRLTDLAAGLIRDPAARARYREQWLADIEGAAELGLRPNRIALGAATAAVRLSVTGAHPLHALASGARGIRIGPPIRATVALAQLFMVSLFLYGVALYALAWVVLGDSGEDWFHNGYDPADLLDGNTTSPLLYVLMMFWLAVHGWQLAALLAPVGLLLSLRGTRFTRWALRLGAVGGLVAAIVLDGEFGRELTIWVLN